MARFWAFITAAPKASLMVPVVLLFQIFKRLGIEIPGVDQALASDIFDFLTALAGLYGLYYAVQASPPAPPTNPPASGGPGVLKCLFIIVLCAAFVSCATLGLKSWSDRTPKEKSLAFMQFYNSEYRDTMALATSPQITPAQKELVKAKKAVLGKLYPLIQGYDDLLVNGKIPSLDLENQILGLINQMGGRL